MAISAAVLSKGKDNYFIKIPYLIFSEGEDG